MDDTSTATTPSPSSASAATAAGYDAAHDKTNAGVAAAVATTNSSSSSNIRLLIKSSNQQYDDMNIESDLCWTVQRLKKQLSLVYPGKPEIADQKLIYSGKLLDDAQKLSEVIRSYKDVYQQHHIFHLVCASKIVNKAPYKTTTPSKDSTPTTRLDTNTNDNELRQRHVADAATASAQIPYQQPPLSMAQPQMPTYPWMQLQNPANLALPAPATSTASQMAYQQQQALIYNAWMQQWYAAYMQQMMQRTSGSGNATPAPMLHPLLQNLPVIPNNMGVPLVGHPPVAVAAAGNAGAVGVQANEAAVAQQPGGRQVDAPNFPIMQEEPEMRDWLDSLFSFTRLAFFITVLYFNSSPMRCVLVVLIASVIYLYHIGVLRRRRERNNNNINRNNNAGNDIAAFAAVQQIQRMMDAALEHDNNPQAAAEPALVDAAAPADAGALPAADDAAADAAAPAVAGAVPSAGLNEADAAVIAAEAVAVDPANANNSVLSVVRTFVVTFFTSLLPEAPAL